MKKFWNSLELFSNNPFDTRLKTHKLTGKLSGLWALSIDYDCRVVFKFTKETNEVLLIDIGSHDEVYKSRLPAAVDKKPLFWKRTFQSLSKSPAFVSNILRKSINAKGCAENGEHYQMKTIKAR